MGIHNHDHTHNHDHSHDYITGGGVQDCPLDTHSGSTHTHTNTKSVLNRLSRAIGHLNAVRNMVEAGRDCSEVLIQLSAVRSAINGICKVILKDHIDHCIVDAVKTGNLETLAELNRAIEMLMK